MSDFFDDSADALAQQAEQDAQSDNKFDPSAGDILHGVFLKAEAYTKGKYEPTIVLTVRNVGDKEVGGIEPGESGYFFTPTVLRRKVIDAEPAMGTAFILEFKGSVTPEKGGNAYKDWTLVAESTKGDGDDSKRDRALWANIGIQLVAPRQTQGNAYGGGNQQAAQDDGWKF